MKLSEVASALELTNINKGPVEEGAEIEHGYVGDLLSLVLAHAQKGSIWFTIQNHMNIIGVASLAGIPAIVICGGQEVPDPVVEKADEEKIALFTSPLDAYQLSGKLYECGIK